MFWAEAELARRRALPAPLPPPDPIGIERRLRDAQDLTDIQSVSAAVTDLEDALEVLRAVGLIAA